MFNDSIDFVFAVVVDDDVDDDDEEEEEEDLEVVYKFDVLQIKTKKQVKTEML